MPNKDRLDKVYEKCFERRPQGFACYKNFSAKKLKPGACGYFDQDGDWVKIVQVTDPNGLMAKKFGPLEDSPDLEVGPDPGKDKWAVMTSQNMTKLEPKIEVKVEIPGAPVGGGVTIKYKAINGAGAILVTEGDITHEQATPPDSLCDWMIDNAPAILKRYRFAEERGLWIITKTYSAKKCAVAALESKETEVTFGVELSAFTLGNIAPSITWWNGHKDSVWEVHEADPDDGVVLFMSGIYWHPVWHTKKVKPTLKRKDQKMLGRRPEDKDKDIVLRPVEVQVEEKPVSGLNCVKLTPRVIGTVGGVRAFDPRIDPPDDEEEEEEQEEDDDDSSDDDD